MHNSRWLTGLLGIVVLAATGCQTPSGKAVTGTPSASDSSLPPLDPAKPRVHIVTNFGDIVVDLDGEAAPCTTANFVRYVREGYYVGTLFHRVMKDYIVQGGGYTPGFEPKTDGVGKPIKLESDNGLSHLRGTIAMARGNLPNSATTQFFINLDDNSRRLNFSPGRRDPGHAVFGTVVGGMAVVDKIANTPVGPHAKYGAGKLAVVPTDNVVIKSTTLLNPDSAGPIEEACADLDRPAEPAIPQEELVERFKKTAEAKTGLSFQTTDEGWSYIDVRSGRGPSPTADDRISIHWIARLADGSVIENTYELAQPPDRNVSRLIEGLQMAITTMNVGGLRTAIIPPELAFKEKGIAQGNPPLIPPNAWVIYDLELLDLR